jgi:hypothetical protein
MIVRAFEGLEEVPVNHELPTRYGALSIAAAVLPKASAWPAGSGQRVRGACGCADPLEHMRARFRVVRRMVGESSFRNVGRRFVGSVPAPRPIPASYGDSFPRFIRAQGQGGSFAYLADIAELEMAVTRARNTVPLASAERHVGAESVATARPDARATLHPSVALVHSRFPIVSIWESCCRRAHRVGHWRPETALVARTSRKVAILRLPAGGSAFLQALARGQTIGRAAEIAAAIEPTFVLANNLALLAQAGALTGLQPSGLNAF